MKKKLRQLKAKDVPKLRNYLLKKQKGICPICGKKINKPVLDHHHRKKLKGTGQIRKTICSNCNIFLAKIENNSVRYAISQEELPFVLVNISKYLSCKQLPYIHPSEAPRKKVLTKASYNKLVKANAKNKKLPVFRYNKKGKPVQGLTKPLKELFELYNIEPEFYGGNKK